jgi:GNAT superfamily N-acetyltransferase
MLALQTANIEAVAAWSDGVSLARLVEDGLARLAAAGYALVSCRRPEADRTTLAALQAAGFRLVESLLTLARPLDRDIPAMPAWVDHASPADAEGCARVGGAAFRYDRFHCDAAIDGKRADALKSAWARNSACGRADTMFVTREGEAITGFNACLLRGETAIVDLIGVAPAHQGRGLGRALMQAALAHYAGSAKRMVVGTQSCNVGSLALYQSLGFRIESSAFTLHAHPGAPPA